MKKVKVFFLGAALALGLSYMANPVTVQAATYTVKSNQGNKALKNTLAKAKKGDIVQVDGLIKSVEVSIPEGVTLRGINGGKIDFSPSAAKTRGITIKANNVTVEDLQIYNAKDNGIYI